VSATDKDTIAEKIRKLFALAEDNGNENEAALAMLKARQLLRQHGLEAEEIRGKASRQGVQELERPFGKPWADWRNDLASAAAELCDADWFLREGPAKVFLVFFGQSRDIEAALATFESLCAACDAALAREKKRHGASRAKLTSPERKIWTDSFRSGFADRVLERVEKLRREESSTSAEEGEAKRWEIVVRAKQADLTLYAEGLGLTNQTAGQRAIFFEDGWQSGQTAAKQHRFGRVDGHLK
jgi:hypothetical protein